MPSVILNDHLLKWVKPEQIRLYIETIYAHAAAMELKGDAAIEIRKLGQLQLEDGSSKSMEETVPCMVASQLMADFDPGKFPAALANWTVERALKSAPAGIGTFMCPAILNDRRATDASVQALLTVCVDLDTGDTRAKLAALRQHIGIDPTFTVHSGGFTELGAAKMHVHYRLTEPCQEPWKVAYIREQLALRVGGDVSFKRIPQVIRIPGTLYDKGGRWATVEIIGHNPQGDVGLEHFEELLDIDWGNLAAGSIWSGGARTKEERDQRVLQLMKEEIHAGAQGNDTRFSRFTEYAGYEIRQARIGRLSVDEAFMDVAAWVGNKMVPPWEFQRIESEFKALLQRDKLAHPDQWAERSRPPMVLPIMTAPAVAIPAAAQPSDLETWDIRTFNVATAYAGEAAPERYLIENFLLHGSVHALVADGGVGKTYLGLELALRLSAGPELPHNRFLGFPILEQAVSIVFTVEDGKDDIHRRLVAIDHDGSLRRAADDWCYVVPVKEQIMGGLTLVEKDRQGNHVASKSWEYLVGKVEEVLQGRPPGVPVFVIIDTYSATHHGDENTATGTNEWFRSAGLLSKFNATLLIMHHVRKDSPRDGKEVRSPADFRATIRGSTAFTQSCRMVYGVWEMPNGDAVMKELPKEKEARLFNLAIVKKNCGADWSDRSDPRYPEPMITLRRMGSGNLLYDAVIHEKRIELTACKKDRLEASMQQLKAAMVYSIRWHAEHAYALTERKLVREAERFLPEPVCGMPRKELEKALRELMKAGTIRENAIKVRGVGTVFDVPEGPYTLGKQIDLAKETPNLEWLRLRYDNENHDYVEINWA